MAESDFRTPSSEPDERLREAFFDELRDRQVTKAIDTRGDFSVAKCTGNFLCC
ncbi:hypothetical protein ACH4VR_36395 [Streptomyces sp. NPDC020883]|uniref:hypothetical protein n=1 Tax=Streptomyces sp. NPDC020883 TaxID=3365099 RepID=UPI0037A85B7F